MSDSVRSWPTYLIWDCPEWLRQAISEEARALDISLAETVRRVLCKRYKMDCEPVTLKKGGSVGYDPEKDTGAQRILLRVHPDLFAKIKRDAQYRRMTMKACIMQALELHYGERRVEA